MSTLKLTLAVVSVFILVALIANVRVDPERARLLAAQEELEKQCERHIADSALGHERRTVRAACEAAERDLARQLRAIDERLSVPMFPNYTKNDWPPVPPSLSASQASGAAR